MRRPKLKNWQEKHHSTTRRHSFFLTEALFGTTHQCASCIIIRMRILICDYTKNSLDAVFTGRKSSGTYALVPAILLRSILECAWVTAHTLVQIELHNVIPRAILKLDIKEQQRLYRSIHNGTLYLYEYNQCFNTMSVMTCRCAGNTINTVFFWRKVRYINATIWKSSSTLWFLFSPFVCCWLLDLKCRLAMTGNHVSRRRPVPRRARQPDHHWLEEFERVEPLSYKAVLLAFAAAIIVLWFGLVWFPPTALS